MFYQFVYLFLIVSCVGTPLQKVQDPPDYRLPDGAVEVQNYAIFLSLDAEVIETNTVFGFVTITFTNLYEQNTIKLHANQIGIHAVTLNDGGSTVIIIKQEFDEVTDIVTFTTRENLVKDRTYSLEIRYVAKVRINEMYGFYRSYYINEAEETTFLWSTQFQPTHARKVFPCFDEPKYKATFDLSIRHSKTYTAWSNTQGTAEPDDIEETFVITFFEQTPKMSTYLLAFVIADFNCSTNEIEVGVPHQVCSRKETINEREVALDAGPKLVKAMEDFTNLPYKDLGIAKMDQFAIPDFSAGAMENWGLITYRETGLLWDPILSSNSYKQRLVNVVAHEIAHMWFGNFLTTHWWSDTFLNEGFARYFQYFATATIQEGWELEKQFVVEQIHSMLLADAETTATALSHDANSPAQVSARFTSVSYNKGATVFRMIEHFITTEKFKEAIQVYLSENHHGITTPDTLWNFLQEKIEVGVLPDGTTLSEVIDSWIKLPGFPLLNVALENNKLKISQKRFLVTGGESTTKWYVPLTYTVSSDLNKFETSTRNWLLPSEDLLINKEIGDDWVIFNSKQVGYYRVNYDDALWERLKTVLKSDLSEIADISRAQLVDDMYNLAKVGIRTYREALDLFEFLKDDTSYYSWYAAFNAFGNMLQRTSDKYIRLHLSEHILGLMQNLLKAVPFETDDVENQIYTFNRVQANTWACRLGLQSCIDNTITEFAKYKQQQNVDKNLKVMIYCNGLRHSTNAQDDFNFLWTKFSETKLATEEVSILSALGCARDEAVLKGYLEKSISSGSGIRQQDALSAFSAVYTQNPEGVDIAFDFLLKNYRAISEYYGSMNSLSNLFNGLASRFTRQDQLDKLEAFLNSADDLTESLRTSAETALENAKSNLLLIRKYEDEMREYFGLPNGASKQFALGVLVLISCLVVTLFY